MSTIQEAWENKNIPVDIAQGKIKRVFYIDQVRELIRMYDKEEMSLSRFCEMLNVTAYLAGAESGSPKWVELFDLLATHGGTIESTASLSVEDINQARASGRMYVREDSLGFVWMPKIDKFPEKIEEVEFLEKWFPLPVEMPEHLKSPDFLFKKKKSQISESGFPKWVKEVIKKRIEYFNDNYHTFEAKQLSSALDAIEKLIPPSDFETPSPSANDREPFAKNHAIIKSEIEGILISMQDTVKMGSDGDYSQEQAVLSDSYQDVANKVAELIWSIIDPENQPNQFGIIL